jgi:hypothetical protein
MVLNVTQKSGEATETTNVTAGAHLRMRVAEVASDGSIVLNAAFERASVDAPQGTTPFGFAWPSTEVLAPDSPPVKRLGETLEKAALHIEVDPDGRAVVTGGLDAFADAVAKLKAPDDRIKGFFSPEQLSGLVTAIFRLDGADDAPREVGKGWQSTESIAMPPAGALDITYDYLVRDADPDVVNCWASPTLSLRVPDQRADDVPAVALMEGSDGRASIVFDRRLGMLRHRKTSLNITTRWTLGDLTVEQNQVSVLNIRLVTDQ